MNRHTSTFTFAFIAFFAGSLCASYAQDKPWTGENVLPVRRPKEIHFADRVNDKVVQYKFSGHWPVKVRDDREGQLKIHDGYHEGWVAKTDFVLSKDAPDYFDR